MKLKTKGPVFWAILAIGLLIVGWLYVMLVMTPSDLKETAYLNIYPGDTQEKVLQQIQTKGKVRSTKKIEFLMNIVGYKSNVKPGQYALKPGFMPFKLVRSLRSGLQTPVKLTFNNMRTVEELAGRLSAQLMTDSLTLLTCFRDTAWRDSLQLTDQNYMCVFIPDTYEVWWNISPEKLRAKFVKAWNYFWDEKRLGEAAKIGLTRAQVSTLASIVEEETKQSDEMPKVAGLYLNRMRIDMPLQADPTVKFAVGDFTIKRILREHTLINSPYNTYKITGLPPGPIRIPSIRALDASLQPNRHSYLYMCAKDDFSGYHAFATTYEQHEANAVKYRMALNRNGIMR